MSVSWFERSACWPCASRAPPAAARRRPLARACALEAVPSTTRLRDALQDARRGGTGCRRGRSSSRPSARRGRRGRCARSSGARSRARTGCRAPRGRGRAMPRNVPRRDVPGHAVVAEVGQRMAERRELPVEHREHARLGRVEDQVVEAEVAVHDATPATRRARWPGMCAGSHSIRRSIASIGSVIEAWYCLVQRSIWRAK